MAIYERVPRLSEEDKRLLQLLAELLLSELARQGEPTNIPKEAIALSDDECAELLLLLEQLLASREFCEKVLFVESLAGKVAGPHVREIFLSGRTRAGRTRAVASVQWSEFQLRLGIGKDIVPMASARPMEFNHFLKMERRLIDQLGIHPRVAALILKLVASMEGEIDEWRFGDRKETFDIIRTIFRPLVDSVRDRKGRGRDGLISKVNVAAACTIIADTSVMFLTRDWGIAGTLSTMAGALAALHRDQNSH